MGFNMRALVVGLISLFATACTTMETPVAKPEWTLSCGAPR